MINRYKKQQVILYKMIAKYNIKYVLAVSLILIFFSCKKTPFESFLIRSGVDEIIDLKVYPNSPILTADGKSSLEFLVKAFVEVQKGSFLDTVIYELSAEDLMNVHIKTGSGELIKDFKYSTHNTNLTVESFVAEFNGVNSLPVYVKIEAPIENNYTKIQIPVNVYVLYDPIQVELANAVTNKSLEDLFTRANAVFANSLVNSPHSMDSRVEFKFNRKIVKNANNLSGSELKNFVLTTCLQNPQDTLHIWFANTSTDMPTYPPMYKINKTFELSGLGMSYVDNPSSVRLYGPEEVGIFMPLKDYISFSKGLNQPTLEYVLGRFFGILPTENLATNLVPGRNLDVDFCPDTYNYSGATMGKEKRTVEFKKDSFIYFRSNNIMDDYSSATTITIDQVKRFRLVLKNCLFRNFDK